ncbi:MAG: TonB-dependent receptor [Burkholderiales bacterium]|nr:TonB-dependent receptor [Burkholderiales bacterium]
MNREFLWAVARFRRGGWSAVLAALALAGTSTPAFAEGDDEPITLESVVVTATRSPAAELGSPASVTIVDRQQLDLRNPLRLGDALADVPGLYVRGAALGPAFPGTGQGVLSLRGIPRTPRTLVMIDGQPVNNALTGGINVVGIPLDSVQRVEVVRGPYSALYGGAAMGGVVNFLTGSPDDAVTEVRAGAGSLAQRGGSLLYRERYASGLGIVLSASYRESDGDPDCCYVVKPVARGGGTAGTLVTGVNPTTAPDGSPRYWIGTQGARPWSQSNALLSLHYSPSPATTLVAGFGYADYAVRYRPPDSYLRDAAGAPVYAGTVLFDDAGTLRRLALQQTDWFTATPAGERDLRSFVRATHRFDGGSELRAQVGLLHNNLWFAQARPGVAQYDSGPGNLTEQPNRRIDADVAWRAPLAANWVLVAGGSLNWSRLDRTISELSAWRNTDTTGATLNTDGGRTDNAAVFVQSEHHFDDVGVSVYAGARFDYFKTDGYARQNFAPLLDATYPRRSFDQVSPKVAIVWEPLRWVSVRASYGEAFRPPALFDLYGRTVVGTGAATLVYEPSPNLGPERVKAFEVGADFAFERGGRASLTVYRQRLEDLIYRRKLPTSTETVTRTQAENVGMADVDGIEASARWPTPIGGLVAFGNLTYHFRYDIRSNDVDPATVGKKLTDVPRTTGSAGIEYNRNAWSGMVAVRYVDHVFPSGDDMNTNTYQGVFGSYDRYTLVTAGLTYRIDPHWRVNLTVDNLTDRTYFVSNRQPGRSAFAELSYRF